MAESLFIHQVCHVGATDEGAAEDHIKAEGEAEVAVEVELLRGDVFGDGEVAAGGLEVLADGGDVGAGGADVGEELLDFGDGFAEADHETAFDHGLGAVAAGEGEDVEGLLVIGLRADATIETGDRFHVVVIDVGAGIEDAGDGGVISVEVGSEDFDAGRGEGAANGADGFGPVVRAAIGKFIAIDAGEDDVFEAHFRGHLGDVFRFLRVQAEVLLGGVALRDGAEAAAARAEVAEDHEGGGATVKAFMNVGAAGRFADGVEVFLAEFAFEFADGFEVRLGLAEPEGEAGPGSLDLHERFAGGSGGGGIALGEVGCRREGRGGRCGRSKRGARGEGLARWKRLA